MLRFLRACGLFVLHGLARLLAWSALAFAFVLALGPLLQFPAAAPMLADAVVVAGGGAMHRYETGKALVVAGYAPRLMLIEPEYPMLLDVSRSLRDAAVYANTTCESTWDEAVQMRQWMAAEGLQRVLVVSDSPHLLRVGYSWFSVFRGSGLEYVLIAAPAPWWSAWGWWENPQAVQFVVGEFIKLGYYLGRYRFGWGD